MHLVLVDAIDVEVDFDCCVWYFVVVVLGFDE